MEKLIACCSGFDIRYEFEIDGEVVGECSVHQSDCYIHSLEIEEMYRNRGYARMMLRAVMSLYPGQRMWLRAWASNTPAIKAYDAVGFKVYERGPYSKYQPEEVVSMEITGYIYDKSLNLYEYETEIIQAFLQALSVDEHLTDYKNAKNIYKVTFTMHFETKPMDDVFPLNSRALVLTLSEEDIQLYKDIHESFYNLEPIKN